MRFKVFVSIAADAIWTWIIGGVFAVIGLIAFFFPDFGALLNWPSLTNDLPWYFWVAVAFFIWAIGFAWSAAKRVFIEPPELHKLAKIRTKGMSLRSKLEKLKTEEEVNSFIDEYHSWEREMLSVVHKLSPSSKETIAHIRNFPTPKLPHDVNDAHSFHRGILETKLNELKNFVDDYRGNLSSG